MSEQLLLAVLAGQQELPRVSSAIDGEIPSSARLAIELTSLEAPSSTLLAAADVVLVAMRIERAEQATDLVGALSLIAGLRRGSAQKTIGALMLWGGASKVVAEAIDHPAVLQDGALSGVLLRSVAARLRMVLTDATPSSLVERLEAIARAAGEVACLQTEALDARRRLEQQTIELVEQRRRAEQAEARAEQAEARAEQLLGERTTLEGAAALASELEEQLRTQVRELKLQVRGLEQRADELQRQLAAAERSAEAAIGEQTRTSRQLSDAQTRVDQLRLELARVGAQGSAAQQESEVGGELPLDLGDELDSLYEDLTRS